MVRLQVQTILLDVFLDGVGCSRPQSNERQGALVLQLKNSTNKIKKEAKTFLNIWVKNDKLFWN